jgi:transposase
MKYSGIDLHSNNCVVVITDENDKIVVSKRTPNRLEEIIALLEPHRDELVGVVVESTYNWYWLVDGLQEAGYVVHLANTAGMVSYEGLKHGNDESDAVNLARTLRLGILPTGHIMEKSFRAIRDLARKRIRLVQHRTSHVVAAQNILSRESGSSMSASAIKRLTPESAMELAIQRDAAHAIRANVAVINQLNEEIERIEKRLQECVALRPEFELLNTVPGIGRILSTIIMLEAGPITRFAQVGHFASYCRCVNSQHLSNGKKKGAGNTKNGNKYLAWAFVEAAHFAMRFCPEAKRFYERKKARANTTLATKALAHKLARACYHMLKESQPFDVKRCFA